MSDKITQRDIILEYYKKHPNRDIEHAEIVDWVIEEYKKRTGKTLRDPDRQIKKLHQEGYLIKVKVGVYRYEEEHILNNTLEDFTQKQKEIILNRDNYKCVVCGKGEKEGVTLHVDHIKPKDRGGKATIENGQALCSEHNFIKKNYNQTETAKKLFINLMKKSQKANDEKITAFCKDILSIYEKHDINGHIKWS